METSAPTSSSYRYYVTGALTLAFTFNYLDRQILSILAEQIKVEFSLSDTQLGLLMGLAFALFYTFIGLGIARIADRTNRVNLVSITIIFWSLMTALCGMATSFVQLLGYRMMVGVGEAGLSPSSHSIISDYFDETQRAGPISIYSLGTTFGHILALLLGGYLAHQYGWRWAFVAVGLPGILVAILIKFTVREPLRGAMDSAPKPAPPSLTLAREIKFILGIPLYRLAMAGHVFTILFGFTLAQWIAPHFMRSYALTEHKAAPIIAIILIIGGVPGMIIGGFGAARLAKRDIKWLARLPAIFVLTAFPFFIGALLSHDLKIATLAFTIGIFALQASAAAPLATIQHAVPAQSRALAAALAFFFSNLIGLGIGPLIVGIISDHSSLIIGPSSLSLGLLVLTLSLPVASVFLWRAQAYLKPQQKGPHIGGPL